MIDTEAVEPFELEAQTAADTAVQLAGEKFATANWPKTLVALMDVTVATLARLGLPAQQAEEVARAVTIAQAKYVGGRPMYLPAGRTLEAALLHDAIYRAHRRGNTEAIAREHGLTTRAVQMIVRQQTLLHRKRLQPTLFPDAS